MKLSIIKTVYLFCLFLCANAFSHNEFYRLNGCDLERIYATSNENILTWQSYNNIQIGKNFALDFPSSELFQSTCETDFLVSLFAWQNVTFQDMGWDDNAPWIKVRFINSRTVFPYPLPGQREIAAGTLYAINDGGNYIVGRNIWQQCEDFRDNYIYFNNCDDKTFYWTHNTYIEYDDILNFKYTLIHELGHEIGLAHCDISSAIMHQTPPVAPYFVNFLPQPPDIEGLNIILGNTVGIEDYIWITQTITHYNINQIFAIATFIDGGHGTRFLVENNVLQDDANYFSMGTEVNWDDFVKNSNEMISRIINEKDLDSYKKPMQKKLKTD